jgi:hypothetical protein
MLKQPTQDLRYVANDETSSSLNAAWADLCTRSADHAPSAAPELVLPFLNTAKISSVYTDHHLLLAVPLQHGRFYDKSHYSPVTDCSLCHADRLNGPAAVSLLLKKRHRPILLRSVPQQSQFFTMLETASGHFATLSRWQRASLRVSGDFDDWLSTSLDQKRRKELRRLRNRLSEQGDLEIKTLGKKDDPEPFISDFLTLEAGGWKGKSGTALASKPDIAAATHQALAALHKSGKLRFWFMMLDGKAIASLFAYVDGNQASLGKIAYDEAFSKYSPGTLLVLDATESFFREGDVIEIDSSAIPGHPMIDHLWRERTDMADIIFAPSTVSRTRFTAIVMAEKMRRSLRAALKVVYYTVTGKSRS